MLDISSTKHTSLLSFRISLLTYSHECQPRTVSELQRGLASRPHAWSSINNSPIDVWRKLQRMFLFTGVRAAIQAQPLAKNRPNPSAWQTLSQTDTNNLAVRTRTNVHIYCTQTPIFITRSPKFILNSTECNFACLSAEHISDLASNQDNW
jgi:hypothetical protein